MLAEFVSQFADREWAGEASKHRKMLSKLSYPYPMGPKMPVERTGDLRARPPAKAQRRQPGHSERSMAISTHSASKHITEIYVAYNHTVVKPAGDRCSSTRMSPEEPDLRRPW